MDTLDSLPPVSEATINQMKMNAQKNYGIVTDQEQMAPVQQPEIVHQEVIEQEEPLEIQQEVQETPVEQKKPDPTTSKERNMRALTAKAAQLEKERDEALRLLKEKAGYEQSNGIQESEDLSFNPDDLVTGKDVARIYEKQKKLEANIYHQQQNNRLRQQYPDFDKVVNAETLNVLRYTYPEIYRTLDSGSDVYATGASAYTIMKNMGIVDTPDINHEKELVKKNSEKPRPLSSINAMNNEKSPLARTNAFAQGLDKQTKDRLWAEMNEARNNY